MQKRVLSIQDISCFGKCSLTVALPVLSAMGIETAVLPTAILSTHTGGHFKDYTFHDMTDEIVKIAEHWDKLDLKFDGIYSGYLGSRDQINIVSDIFDRFGNSSLKLVDPVMGDEGRMYSGFDESYAMYMRKLCSKSDVIVPNLTEACLILGEPYKESYDEEYIKNILTKLCELGCKSAIITGISFDKDKIGAYCFDKGTGKYFAHFTKHYPHTFYGTGDCFSSCLFGAITLGYSLDTAVKTALDFVSDAINNTLDDLKNHWYSVKFEQSIPMLIESLKSPEEL